MSTKPPSQSRLPLDPVLIANRGEIAIRIARTCRTMGFPTVAVYSEADHFAEHVKACDRAICIGPPAPAESYLNVDRILEAARITGARYIHPGYGFLSERAHFVDACQKAGLTFVGPSAEVMRLMGDKIRARETVDTIGVPRVPGSKGAVKTADEAMRVAKEIGYPVLLKAAAGGGGKGMRRVDQEKDLPSAFEGATRESQNAFGDGSLYVEKFIIEPHHVEIQVFGDGRGGAIHLGERECSIQRRHQKVWEESPAPILEKFPKTREAMFEAALKITRYVKYASAGTLEFIVDGRGNFYFLEMNTRLQVEHPVTEWITGADIVAWQMELARGGWMLPQEPVRRGSSIEVRLYAEDPYTFLPAPGDIDKIHLPSGAFVRVDSAYHGQGGVKMNYDPMIAKISVWAPHRKDTIDRLRTALDETRILSPKRLNGIPESSLRTNLQFLKRLVRLPAVLEGDTTTDLIARHPELVEVMRPTPTKEVAIAVSLFQLLNESGVNPDATDALAKGPRSLWQWTSRREGVRP